MAASDCIDEINRAAGRTLSTEEMDDLVTELNRRVAERRKLDVGEDLETTYRAAVDEYSKEMKLGAIIEKRNAAISLKRRLEIIDTVRSGFADDFALGMEAVTVGSNRAVKGSRNSAAAQQTQLMKYYLGGLFSDVERAGLWKEFVSGAFDRDIARALWSINRAEPKLAPGIPKQAAEIAKSIAKWQEVARQDANASGAWIKKLEGYITRQSHDPYKLRRAAGAGKTGEEHYLAWRDAILPKLDVKRTFEDGVDPDKFLRGAYKGLASGIHLKSGAPSEPSGFKGPRNIAKKVSEERVLHFKDADAWFDYNAEFGMKSIRESVIRSLDMSAQTTGLMRRFGPNPEATWNEVVADLAKRITDPLKQQKFMDKTRGKLRNQLRTVDGTSRMPVNHMGAQISAGVRSSENLSKLGMALLSQFTDLPIYASEFRYQDGSGYLSGIAEGVGNLMKGRSRHQLAEIDGMIGVVMDGMKGGASTRFSAVDDVPGNMTRLEQLFFKYNGMTGWTDRLRAGAQRSMAHRLALNIKRDFGQLGPDLRRVLSLYGIGEGQWNIIRKAATKEADGRAYVTPEGVMEMPDEAFGEFLTAQGMKITPHRIATAKREIADQLRTYYVDRGEIAVVTPDDRTRAFMQRGTQPGTVEGETLRFVGQFKSFTVAFMQKVAGREIYGRGSNTLREALKNGNGEMLGLAQLMLWTTAFGYISMAAKDLAKGRTPRAWDDPKTWAAALAQGGGAGIYGDFLFGELNRHGGSALVSFLGPTAGSVDQIYSLYVRTLNGDDASAAAVRALINNTPFANLFYSRIVMDYLFLWSLQEAMNPGSLRRMERKIEKDNGQTFLVRPSQDRSRVVEEALR